MVGVDIGGTAINLFYRDMPRLAIDIDLTYLPVAYPQSSLEEIHSAFDRIVTAITARNLCLVPTRGRPTRSLRPRSMSTSWRRSSTPGACGLATWFIVPDELEDSVREAIAKLPKARSES